MANENKKVASIAVEVTADELRGMITKSIIDDAERTYYDEDGEEVSAGLGGGLMSLVCAEVVKAVRKEFEDQIQSEVQRAIEEAVKAQIASGFFTVGQYGERSQPKTLNQLIQEQLKTTSSAGYREPSRTRAEHVIAEAVEKALQTELAVEVKQIRESFSAQVKAKLSASAAEAISRAMGIY